MNNFNINKKVNPKGLKQNEYDVIIIGAGIGGLTCGCYLAKAGMKVLIVEKNSKPGGYCTSFKRGGFTFDACVHSLGSLREDGILRIILRELDIEKRLEIKRNNPSDIIITPDFKIHFWNSFEKTLEEFQEHFPKESKKIEEFFNFIINCGGMTFGRLAPLTFQSLLDKYFDDEKLKAVLSLPLLGNAGLPAKQLSATVGAYIYKEFMFDGGYYPDGSIQSFPDILVARYKEFGGDIVFSCPAKKIKLQSTKVEGVELEKAGFIPAKYIISNVDATQTFTKLIGKELISKKMANGLESMVPSHSAFILYLGTDGRTKNIPENSIVWFLPHYNIDDIYDLTIKGEIDNLGWFLTRLSSDRKSLYICINVPFINETYWRANKRRLIDVLINKMEHVFPGLLSHIIYKDAATPNTLHRWTLNHKGATYGWAWTPLQFASSAFTKDSTIQNLYLTGHWTTLAHGVAGVAYVGRNTSKEILNKKVDHVSGLVWLAK